MSIYTITFDEDELESLSEIGSRELTIWRGVKNADLQTRYITDGTLLFDKNEASSSDLFEKIIDRDSEEEISNNKVGKFVERLREEDQREVKVLGQTEASNVAMGVKAEWVVFVTDGENYYVFDATSVDMAYQLIGKNVNLKVGESGTLTFWSSGELKAAVAGWNFFDVEEESEKEDQESVSVEQ